MVWLKKVEGEVLTVVVMARRKTRGQTPFELGIGYVANEVGRPNGEIRIRTEQIESDVAPVVGTLELEDADKLSLGLQKAISIAKAKAMPPISEE